MEIKFKKLDDNAVLPSYAKEGDAGLDLTATSLSYDEFGNVVYGTGLAIEIPEGYVGLIFPRSSNSKQDLLLKVKISLLSLTFMATGIWIHSGELFETVIKLEILN